MKLVRTEEINRKISIVQFGHKALSRKTQKEKLGMVCSIAPVSAHVSSD